MQDFTNWPSSLLELSDNTASMLLTDDNSWLKDQLKNNKYKLICLNDSDSLKDFEKTKEEMKNLFEDLFPNKSSFEKTE